MRPWASADGAIAVLAVVGIAVHLAMRLGGRTASAHVPLLIVLTVGGAPLVVRLAARAVRGTFGSDFLAAVSIVAAFLLGEYLASAIIVLMLSGGEALERYAVAQATAVYDASDASMSPFFPSSRLCLGRRATWRRRARRTTSPAT